MGHRIREINMTDFAPGHRQRAYHIICDSLERDFARGIYTREQIDAYKRMLIPELLVHELLNPAVRSFVAIGDGRIVGTLATVEEDGGFEVSRLFSDPEFRGFGIGSAMLKYAEDQALRSSYDSCFTDIVDNPAIRKIFRVQGYTEECRITRPLHVPATLFRSPPLGTHITTINQVRMRKRLE
jgi:GNAT superfamily N-acetyltransferase